MVLLTTAVVETLVMIHISKDEDGIGPIRVPSHIPSVCCSDPAGPVLQVAQYDRLYRRAYILGFLCTILFSWFVIKMEEVVSTGFGRHANECSSAL